jgi:microcystin-dependent protein
MGLETGNYPSDLVETNPLGTDDRSQGDDHIRLLKHVLKTTFPNVNGAITATEEQINQVAADGTLCFPGMIVMWSGDVTSIPAGWKLCNGTGTISTGGAVPDLRSRFIVGTATNSGGTYNVGQTGGSANIIVTGTTNGHALTINQIPSHNHTLSTLRGNNGGGSYIQDADSTPEIRSGATDFTGGGQAHSHGLNVTLTNANLPPYYALAFLIKN